MVVPDLLENCPGCGSAYLSEWQIKTIMPCGHASCRCCAIKIVQGKEECQGCKQGPHQSLLDLHSHPATPQPNLHNTHPPHQQHTPTTVTMPSRKSFLPVSVSGNMTDWQVPGPPPRQASFPNRTQSHHTASSTHDTLNSHTHTTQGTLPNHTHTTHGPLLNHTHITQGTTHTHTTHNTLPSHTTHNTLPSHTTHNTLPSHTTHNTLPTHLPIHTTHGTIPSVSKYGNPLTHTPYSGSHSGRPQYGTPHNHSRHHNPITSTGHDPLPSQTQEYQEGRPNSTHRKDSNRLHQEQDASWRSKKESEAGQTAVDHLRLQYEKQLGATVNLGHNTTKVPPGRIPTNQSLLSKRPISKSAGEVTQANKASGYYVNTKNYANKHSGQYGSTKNLTKGVETSGQQRPTPPQPPPRKHSSHPEIVKPRIKIPKPVERSAKTSIPNVKTPPPAKFVHRGVQRGKGEVRVTDQGLPSSPGTTPNSQDGKDVVDGMDQHTSRRIYIVPSHDPLQYHDPSHQHTLKEEAPWLRQDKELAAAKEELQALKDENTQLEAQQREKREAVSILEQEVVRQRDEIKKLRLEVNQLRIQPCEHNLEETQTLAAMKENLQQEKLQQEIQKREILQREMEQLTERMMEEQHQRESERLRESQVTAQLRRQLREAREQLSERTEPPPEVPNTHTVADSQGLPNLGNSCYINAVMQCLFSITQLRLYFKEDRHKKELNMESEQGGEVATAFGNMFRVLENGKRPYGNLKDFQTVLCTHDDLFQPNLQQDAHELLACLLLWLHNDLSLVHQTRPQQYRQVDQGNNKSTNRNGHQISSVINNLFQGVKESRIICPHTGSLLSSTTEIFRILTLTVPGRDVSFLEQLLRRHCQGKLLDWECEKCGRVHQCVYSTRLVSLPTILVIHFNRDANGPCEEAGGGGTGEEGAAGKARVVYPSEGLNLDTFVTREDGCSPVYDLVSVCIHQGTTSSGHYTAYCRSGSGGGWWLWDDANLQAAQLNQVVSQPDAHLLFYQATHDSYV